MIAKIFTETNLKNIFNQRTFKINYNLNFYNFAVLGPLVQWIEFKIPVLKMEVRILQGSRKEVSKVPRVPKVRS